jgi:S-(hydroxymethyl)glutathione dehydrogenase / alcohol dehydrogenase
MKFKAAVLTKVNKPLEILMIENEPLQFGQVLVKIFFTGICRSQLMEKNGCRGEDKYIPHLMGHEATGTVVEVGKGVNKVSLGDNVILTWIKTNGINSDSPKYYYNNELINSGLITTFSEYSVISENRLVKIPKNLPLDVGVLFGCALQTGAGMVFNEIKPSKEMSIVVIGLGGIGLSALMALKFLECENIIAIDISDEKLSLAKDFGAKHLINSKKANPIKELNKILDNGADICIESGGKIETIELGFSLIKSKSGSLYFASHPPEGEYIKIAPHELISGKKIFGSWGGGCNPDEDIPKLAEIYFSGKFPIEKLITKSYNLNEINNAFDDLENGNVFRPIIKI